MSFATWPAAIPGPERSALRRVPVSTIARRRVQSGRTEVRRFGAAAPDRLAAPLVVAAAEYDSLVEFYESDCNLGTVWFTADWIQTLGYAAGYVGRIIGLPKIDFDTGIRRIEVSMLIQHQDNI